MAEYWESDELKQVAERLIANYHPHLANAKIAYIFKDKCSRRNLTLDGSEQQIVWGSASKMGSGKYEILTGKDMAIEIGYDEWQQWNSTQRDFVVDHYLSQLSGEEDDKNGEMKFFTIPVPIGFFPDVINRHGMPFDQLRDAYRVMRAADQKATTAISSGSATGDGDQASS